VPRGNDRPAGSGDPALTISRQVARRYLLGQQGLWPGRRWEGRAGTIAALQKLGAVQMDPLTIVARSHDLVLWSRVADYEPQDLDDLLYRERAFFDYGGHLDIYPMEELPYWRLHMRRRLTEPRQAAFAATHGDLLDEVRAAVRERGPLGNRDLSGQARVQSYRGSKDSGVALYHLWLIGELMTHSRQGFERRYDLRERIAPPNLDYAAPEAEVLDYFALRGIEQRGLFSWREWAGFLAYRLNQRADLGATQAIIAGLLHAGQIVEIAIEGQRDRYYAPATALSLLHDLVAERVPQAWQPLGKTTADEVILLSPLDNLLGRKRIEKLFAFEYIWEIYKPAARRRWGAYTMPIIYDDRLAARIDVKLDRPTNTLWINGFWPEDERLTGEDRFVQALVAGLSRFAHFHQANAINLDALQPARLREQIQAGIEL